MTYAFPLTAFSDNVPMTVPSVSKLQTLGMSKSAGMDSLVCLPSIDVLSFSRPFLVTRRLLRACEINQTLENI